MKPISAANKVRSIINEDKGPHPTEGTVHAIDGTRIDVYVASASMVIRNVPVIGDVNGFAPGMTVRLTWKDNRPTATVVAATSVQVNSASAPASIPGELLANLPYVPRCAVIWGDDLTTTVTVTSSISTSQDHCVYYGPLSADANDGDTYRANLFLAAGTYTMKVLTIKAATCGKFDVYIDDVLISSGNDLYAGTTTYSYSLSITNITIAANGHHNLKIVVNGKHASATDYRFLCTKISFISINL
jgi:hypothetical protein